MYNLLFISWLDVFWSRFIFKNRKIHSPNILKRKTKYIIKKGQRGETERFVCLFNVGIPFYVILFLYCSIQNSKLYLIFKQKENLVEIYLQLLFCFYRGTKIRVDPIPSNKFIFTNVMLVWTTKPWFVKNKSGLTKV